MRLDVFCRLTPVTRQVATQPIFSLQTSFSGFRLSIAIPPLKKKVEEEDPEFEPAPVDPSFPFTNCFTVWWWMARTNKYASVNFNDIYDKKPNTNSASAATASGAGKHSFSASTARKSYSVSAASRTSHGMLVLSRPSPKPQPQPQFKIESQSQPQNPPPISAAPQTPPPLTDHQSRFESDSISLRPLGKTGSGPLLPSPAAQFPGLQRVEKEAVTKTATPKANKFVPPHLRPGFVAKKEAPSAAGGRGRERGGFRPGSGGIGSPPAPYGEDGRPKSGSGYEMVMGRRGLLDPAELNRPRSSGTHRSSSG